MAKPASESWSHARLGGNLFRKDNPMSDQGTRFNVDELVDNVVAMYVIADGLQLERARGIAKRVFTIAVIDENNRMLSSDYSDIPSNEELEAWDRNQAAFKAVALLSEGTWTVEIALDTLLNCCFKNSRNGDFHDTDEIKTFAGASYAAGMLTRRKLPRLAKLWIERRLSA